MTPRRALLLSLFLALSAAAADAQTNGTESEAVVSAPASTGLDLYRQQYCGLCHALDRAETAGIFGPTHNQLVSVAEQRLQDEGYKGKAKTVEEYIRESITDPNVYLVPGFETTVHRMPAYTHLSPEAVDAIVIFLIQEE